MCIWEQSFRKKRKTEMDNLHQSIKLVTLCWRTVWNRLLGENLWDYGELLSKIGSQKLDSNSFLGST